MHGSDLRSGQEIRINGVVLRLLPEGLDPVGCRDYDGAWEAFYTERQREEPETYPPDKKPPVIWQAPKGMERFVVVDDGGCLGALEMGTYLDDDANPQPRLAWI